MANRIKFLSLITTIYLTGLWQKTTSDTNMNDLLTKDMNKTLFSSYENINVNSTVEAPVGKPQWQNWLDFSQIAISAVGKWEENAKIFGLKSKGARKHEIAGNLLKLCLHGVVSCCRLSETYFQSLGSLVSWFSSYFCQMSVRSKELFNFLRKVSSGSKLHFNKNAFQ